MDNFNNSVLLNLHDSVSRIVDNIGFSVIDDTAHAKLVNVLVKKLSEMSQTSRMLTENAGRNAISLNAHVDMKHLYRIHHVDLKLLVEYVEQVRPFPPKPKEVHRIVRIDDDSKDLEPVEEPAKSKEPAVSRQSSQPLIELPVFDDLDDFELGFSSREPPPLPPPPQNPIFLPPPPPPPPIPPLFLPDDLQFEKIPEFDPEIPPPNYTTPEEVRPVKLKIVQNYEKKTAKKAEKAPSNSSMTAPKMSKKRILQSNYERRLRDEQKACEEMRRERREEKRRFEFEILRKHAEREAQRLSIKIPKEVIDDFNRKVEVPTVKVESKSKTKKKSIETTPKPLPKLVIRHNQINDKQMVIKKVTTKKSRFINGEWQEKDCNWKVPRSGVLSEVLTPQKPRDPIPKLRLVRTSSGEYRKV